MGRDDARAVPGLAGGRAPARAFAAYMARAVGGTPPEPLVTDLPPDATSVEPDAEAYGITEAPPGEPAEPGTPAPPPISGDVQQPAPAPASELDKGWLEKTLSDKPQG
jgi:penicillin-binding protein 1A